MARLHFDTTFDDCVADVFTALIRMLALRRWDPTVNTAMPGRPAAGAGAHSGARVVVPPVELPRAGCLYRRQTTTALRTGRVVEVIRPVSITLLETLADPPCLVSLRQRWRLDSVDDQTRLSLCLEYRLNQAATLRQWHWRRQLTRHGRRMLDQVRHNVRWQQSVPSADSTH